MEKEREPIDLITTNRLRCISKWKFTRVLTSTKSKVIFLPIPLNVRLVMRSIVSRVEHRHHICATIRKRTHQNTMCTRRFFSLCFFSSTHETKKMRQKTRIRTNENKYLLHSFKHVFLLLVLPFWCASLNSSSSSS